MNIFDVLNGRKIVYANADSNFIVTYNDSLTLQLYVVNGGEYTEVEVCTLSDKPENEKVLRSKAKEFHDAFGTNWRVE